MICDGQRPQMMAVGAELPPQNRPDDQQRNTLHNATDLTEEADISTPTPPEHHNSLAVCSLADAATLASTQLLQYATSSYSYTKPQNRCTQTITHVSPLTCGQNSQLIAAGKQGT